MNIKHTKWKRWMAAVENTWFYIKNPSLFHMSFEPVEIKIKSDKNN